MSEGNPTENGNTQPVSSLKETSTQPSTESKEEEVISLRPGGGFFGSSGFSQSTQQSQDETFSFRPGGGFFGAKKTTGTSSKGSEKSSSTFSSSSEFPAVFTQSKFTKPEVELESPDPFINKYFDSNPMSNVTISKANVSMPEELAEVISKIPDLRRTPSAEDKKMKIRQTGTGQRQQARTQQQQLGRRAADRYEPRLSFVKDDKDQTLRNIKGTLNKLTVEKFDKLSEKLCDLISSIVEEDAYSQAVSLVFTKAVSEPNFSTMYADLCVKLNERGVALPNQKITFRRVLLNKCQEEFEAAYQLEDKSLPEDPEERTIFKEKQRRRKLGNVKFIGELFKCGLVSERIIHECIKILLHAVYKSKEKDIEDKELLELHCELLCKLMATIGKLIDTPKAKPYMDTYFEQLTKLSQDSALSARIRFMFQDILELRKNHWIPRREENIPKTISEVHAEAAAKDFESELYTTMTHIPPQQELPRFERKVPSSHASPVEGFKKEEKKSNKKKKSKTKQTASPTASASSSPRQPQAALKVDNIEVLESKLNAILDDYFSSLDVNEAVISIRALRAKDTAKLVELAVSHALEQKEDEHDLLIKLLSALSKEKLLSEDSFIKGFAPIVSMIDDLEVDIPFAAKIVGKLIGGVIRERCMPASYANTLPEKIKKSLDAKP